MPGTWFAISIDVWLTFTGAVAARAAQARWPRQPPSPSTGHVASQLGMIATSSRDFPS